MPDHQHEQPERSPAQPLDYFTAHAPDVPSRPGLSIGWIILALGWVPFICGVVNSQAAARSGVSDVIAAHRNAAVLFSALGLLAMIASVVLFVRHRDGIGFLAAILSLMIASGMAMCLAVSIF